MLWRESWAPMEILRIERNMGKEKCTPRRPHLGSRRRSHCSRATHHWRRDYSCPGCRGPAEWHHGSAGLAPSTAVLCPAGSLWDLCGGCRSHLLWCLLPPFQPWGRRDMGTETWEVNTLDHPSLSFYNIALPCFLKHNSFCFMGESRPPTFLNAVFYRFLQLLPRQCSSSCPYYLFINWLKLIVSTTSPRTLPVHSWR